MISCVCYSTSDPPCDHCILEALPFSGVDLNEDTDTNQYVDFHERVKMLLDQKDTFVFHESIPDIFHSHQEFDPDYNFYSDTKLNCRYFTVDDYLEHEPKTHLQIICLNIRSAVQNLEKLKVMFNNQIDLCPIIALTETWFNDHTQSLYQIEGFNGFHTVRPNNKRGGGVLRSLN